jgi:hypothetical protein
VLDQWSVSCCYRSCEFLIVDLLLVVLQIFLRTVATFRPYAKSSNYRLRASYRYSPIPYSHLSKISTAALPTAYPRVHYNEILCIMLDILSSLPHILEEHLAALARIFVTSELPINQQLPGMWRTAVTWLAAVSGSIVSLVHAQEYVRPNPNLPSPPSTPPHPDAPT